MNTIDLEAFNGLDVVYAARSAEGAQAPRVADLLATLLMWPDASFAGDSAVCDLIEGSPTDFVACEAAASRVAVAVLQSSHGFRYGWAAHFARAIANRLDALWYDPDATQEAQAAEAADLAMGAITAELSQYPATDLVRQREG